MIPLGIQVEEKKIVVDFDLGDTIIVTRGVWENTVAEIKRIDEHKEMVTINVDMFGRETPVEISFADVKKMD